jgi:hypothetical protein
MNEHDIYIPLWHTQLLFHKRIQITINPILPENIIIDDDNNIIVKMNEYQPFINFNEISISISENEFKIKKIIGKGIPRIKNNIYDISELSDIIIV